MKRLMTLVAAVFVFTTLAATSYAATLKIQGFKPGTVLMVNGKEVVVTAETVIPDGAQVSVTKGQAVFSSGGAIVTASAGDAFKLSGAGDNIQVDVTAGKVDMQAGDLKTSLSKGQGAKFDPSVAGGQAGQISSSTGTPLKLTVVPTSTAKNQVGYVFNASNISTFETTDFATVVAQVLQNLEIAPPAEVSPSTP